MSSIPMHLRTHLGEQVQRFIPSPNAKIYRIWETFLVILAVYTACVSPLIGLGFLEEHQAALYIMDNVINGFFAVDIVVFFVAHINKVTYWPLFDVISIIPYHFVPLQTYGLLNLLRLCRLQRVSAFFSRVENDRSHYNYFWVQCAKLICVTLFALHCATRYFNPKRMWTEASMEMIFDLFYLLFMLGFTTYLVGDVTKLLHGTRSIVCIMLVVFRWLFSDESSAPEDITSEPTMPFSHDVNARNGGMKKSRVLPTRRVTISCPQKGDFVGILVSLPRSFKELLDLGAKKYGIDPKMVLLNWNNSVGEVSDIEVIRDDDHLIFVVE